LGAAPANLQQSELNLGYTKVYAPVDGYLTNVNTSRGGVRPIPVINSSPWWIQIRFGSLRILRRPSSILSKPGRTVKMTLMGYHDEPFEGKIDQRGLGHLRPGTVPAVSSTGLLAAVKPKPSIGFRLPERFPGPYSNHWKVSDSPQDRSDSYPLRCYQDLRRLRRKSRNNRDRGIRL